jgi:hypothetical protein
MQTWKLVLYTNLVHKVPVDYEGTELPICVVDPKGRTFAASIIEGGLKMDGDRHIYLEITGMLYHLPTVVTPL